MNRNWLFHATLAAFVASTAAGQPASIASLDFSRAWFSPTLVVSSSPLCDNLLGKATAIFRRDEPLWQLEAVWGRNPDNGLAYLAEGAGLDTETVPTINGTTGLPTGESHEAQFVTTGDRKVYVHVSKSIPFGNWTRVFLDPPPVFGPGASAAEADYLAKSAERKRGEPTGWLRTPAGEIVATDYRDRHLTLSRLSPSATWELVCSVIIEPDIESSADPEIRELRERFTAVVTAMSPLDGRENSCTRHYRRVSDFYEAIYRPIVLSVERRDFLLGGRANLRYWALGGLGENSGVAAFDARIDEAAAALGRFYERHYGWPSEPSLEVAHAMLLASTGFPFGSEYVAPSNRELRAAILRGAPLDEIARLPVDRTTLDGGDDEESILDAAVGHPEALRYLLDLGASANQPNGFGKTPLMYAAQHNQLESVRLLLERGADPNAATVWPRYPICYYDLRRAKMTPLHYAVRYASAEIVKTLLARGAEPLVKIESRVGEKTVFPLDWLQLYAGSNARERNPHIDAAAFAELSELLAVPTEEEQLRHVRRLVLDGQAAYRLGDVATAFAALQKALNVMPNDERALSDMSLVALRHARPLEALDAAARLIAQSKDTSLVANAWFNRGLACQEFGRVDQCPESRIYDFVQSALAAESRGRLAKLDELFATTSCVDQHYGTGAVRYLFTYAADDSRASRVPSSYVYVQHPRDLVIEPATVLASQHRNDPPGQFSPAVPMERRDFSRFAVSSFRAAGVVTFDVKLSNGGRCEVTAR